VTEDKSRLSAGIFSASASLSTFIISVFVLLPLAAILQARLVEAIDVLAGGGVVLLLVAEMGGAEVVVVGVEAEGLEVRG
jgi:hypothetical protein